MGSIPAKLLIVGLDNAGKTKLIRYFEEGPNDKDTEPSAAFDTHSVKSGKVKFDCFDVAGKEKVRELWKHYYDNTDGIVFVVDSTDPDRFEEAKHALEGVVRDPTLKAGIPVVVLANKCKSDGAASVKEVKKALALEVLLDGRQWEIKHSDAKHGDGIDSAFKWMSERIKEARKAKH